MLGDLEKGLSKYKYRFICGTKATCDTLFWFFICVAHFAVGKFFYSEDICDSSNNNLPFFKEAVIGFCQIEYLFQYWAISWIIFLFIRIPLLVFQKTPLLMLFGLRLKRADGNNWCLFDGVIYGLVEWLPVLIGAVYILTFNMDYNFFNLNAFTAIVYGVQIVWLAPVLFRFNGRNLAQMISGVDVIATDKKESNIRKSYEKRINRSVRKLTFALNDFFAVFLFLLFAFVNVQMLRIPSENPNFQNQLYGGYEIVWENNLYIAMKGLSAPPAVVDFYDYGRQKAYENYKLMESYKKNNGVKDEYLYVIPSSDEFTVSLDLENEIKINGDDWKELRCIYSVLDAADLKNLNCASFEDFEHYIEQNRVIWDRYNAIPELGNRYVMLPQHFGDGLRGPDLIRLVELKAAHIIYLAKSGKKNEAMEEWLKYMGLYKKMASEPSTFILKASIAFNIGAHIRTLEKLLVEAPDLARVYEAALIAVLNSDEPLYRDSHLWADDWGLVEPLTNGMLGNLNAMHNKHLECIDAFKELAELPFDQYPYEKERIELCDLNVPGSSLREFVIQPALIPGNYFVNAIYSVLIRGALKGEEILKHMKFMRVRFRLAQLAVIILADGVETDKISDVVKAAPDHLQNPISKTPFIWDELGTRLYFVDPGDEEKEFSFVVNTTAAKH